MFPYYTGMMPDVNPIPQSPLITELRVPDKSRDAIYTYLRKIWKVGIAKRYMQAEQGLAGDKNELLSHALGYAMYERLPEDVRNAIAQLREGEEGKPVLVLRNLVGVPSAAGSRSISDNDRMNTLLLKGMGAMLGANYASENIEGGYYSMDWFKTYQRGPGEYHRDYQDDCPFTTLLCMKPVPDAPTVFVPISESRRLGKRTGRYKNPGEKAELNAGDLVMFDNRRVIHARHDLDPDDQERAVLAGFHHGQPGEDRSISPFPSHWSEPEDKDMVRHWSQDVLPSQDKARQFRDLLQEGKAAQRGQQDLSQR